MHNKTLTDLQPNEHGTVKDIKCENSMRRRLQDIGFINGTQVKCLFKSPLGDPVAYRIKGTTVALRHEDASKILLE